MVNVEYHNLGTIDYRECWDLQRSYFERLLVGDGTCKLILCSHPAVYTLGKSADEHNLLIDQTFLDKIGAELFRIERGGDITFHGQGQIVGYPILNLNEIGISLRNYIAALEQAVIDVVARYGIKGTRLEGASGVWLENPWRKICAVGVRASRSVTMHGFALNVATDLRYFDYINPCGMSDKGVTSLEKELGHAVDLEQVKGELVLALQNVLNVKIIENSYVNSKEMGSQDGG